MSSIFIVQNVIQAYVVPSNNRCPAKKELSILFVPKTFANNFFRDAKEKFLIPNKLNSFEISIS